MYYISLLMVLIYVGIGLLFLLTNFLSIYIPDNRIALGTIFVTYGLFRGIMIYNKYKKQKSEI